MKLFQNKNYYKPEMKGFYSIKKVLSALVPEMKYDDLDISEGGSASREFENLYYEQEIERIKQVRNSLLEYCNMDSTAMVKILTTLYKV
jgi:hypothetical protein